MDVLYPLSPSSHQLVICEDIGEICVKTWMPLGISVVLLLKENVVVTDSQLIIQKLNSSKFTFFLIGVSSCHRIEFSSCLLVPKVSVKDFISLGNQLVFHIDKVN